MLGCKFRKRVRYIYLPFFLSSIHFPYQSRDHFRGHSKSFVAQFSPQEISRMNNEEISVRIYLIFFGGRHWERASTASYISVTIASRPIESRNRNNENREIANRRPDVGQPVVPGSDRESGNVCRMREKGA